MSDQLPETSPAWPIGASEMAGRMRAFDWGSTGLGPIERWPIELRTMLQAVLELPQPASICWGPDALLLYNDAYGGILLDRHPGALGRKVGDVWPELIDVLAPAVEGVLRGEPQYWENVPFELERGGEGRSIGWFTAGWAPVRLSDGSIGGFQMIATEATLEHRARERLERSEARLRAMVEEVTAARDRQQQLLAELQHRVRNMLAVIRSVFSRTVDGAADLADAADHFRGRLESLARTQVVTTRAPDAGVDLQDLIRDELLSVGVSDGAQVTIDGPDVELPSPIAEQLGLAIHELTTNSVKYGALKIAEAQLNIRWQVNVDCRDVSHLRLTWTEQGVPAVLLAPARRGFGSELILEAMPYRLRAETELKFMGGGIRCTISLPLV